MIRRMTSLQRLSRREALRLTMVGAVTALAAACTAPAPAAQPTTAVPSSPDQPRSGGALRVGVLGDLQGLDGHLTTGLDSLRRVWDVTSVLDVKLNTVPVLAQSLDVTPDATQMTIKLRQGVHFHTGRELTADDLV